MNLLELVGADTPLVQRRGEWWGCCPFHAEKSPSFSVNQDKGVYSCFGCGARGDAVTYLMQKRGLSMRAALRAVGRSTDQDAARHRKSDLERIQREFFAWKRERLAVLNRLHDEIELAEMAYRSMVRAPDVWTEDEKEWWPLYLGDLYLALDVVREDNERLSDPRTAWEEWRTHAK